MKTPSLTIAIPAYNEEDSIRDVVSEAIEAAKSFTSDFEVLLVDDGSTDTTGTICDEYAKQNSHIIVIHHTSNQGFSGAIKTCYKKASKELIFLLPADGQIHASDAHIFLKKATDADVVVGYRISNPEPIFRRINSAVFHTLYRTLFGVKLREISTSILWRKSVLDSINITALERSALIEPEVIYKAWVQGYRFCEVPIPYYHRKGGKPKGANPMMIIMTIKELLRLWWSTKVFYTPGQ
jgi:glycosyltransferase involved in cell wall biosynthesis